MKIIAAASLVLAAIGSLAPLPAYAQGPNSSLQARVAALEARVAKLEGQINAADLAGVYRVVGFIADGSGGNTPSIGIGVIYGTVTLVSGGSGSGSLTIQGHELTLSAPAQETPFLLQGNNEPLTWSYAAGTLTITIPDDVTNFNVSAGGRVLTAAKIGDDGDKDLLILSRLQ